MVISKRDAKAQNLTRYFTGMACKNGHIAERRTANSTCVVCQLNQNRLVYLSDPEKELTRNRERYSKNPNRQKELAKARREADPSSAKLRYDKWSKANKGKTASYCADRRVRKIQASVPWADQKKIDELYEMARLLTETTGVPHCVDHIYPLNSDVCCGLHVENNLQVLTKSENSRKGNKMPEDYWLDFRT